MNSNGTVKGFAEHCISNVSETRGEFKQDWNGRSQRKHLTIGQETQLGSVQNEAKPPAPNCRRLLRIIDLKM